jgi:hypothetical protein
MRGLRRAPVSRSPPMPDRWYACLRPCRAVASVTEWTPKDGPIARPRDGAEASRSARDRCHAGASSAVRVLGVARSLYKGERLGSRPACAICVGAGQGERAELHLPCGVRVWLCAAHRSREFQTARAGRDFVTSLMHVWRSSGCLTRRRSRALGLHQARITQGPARRDCPGSYAWPALRREAETAFAAGEAPGRVIQRLRRRVARGEAEPPSVRTMRRWFREGRWLTGRGTRPARRPARPSSQRQGGRPAPGSERRSSTDDGAVKPAAPARTPARGNPDEP